ncbi:MAG: hypothetical protein AAF211_32780, partial [Myxococcota bacterium]
VTTRDTGGEPPLPDEGDTGDALGPRFASGTRLEARGFRPPGSGGGAVFATFFDTELQTPCAFARATDDVLRCLPIPDPLGPRVAYLDADCQQPVDTFPCDGPPYVTQVLPREPTDACDTELEMVEVRSVTSAPADGLFVVDPTDGGCSALGGGLLPAVGAIGAVVAPETFVGSTIEERWTRQGFGARTLVADDGAVLRRQLLLDAGADCAVRYLDGLGPRCLPADHAVLGSGPGTDWWFGDVRCIDDPLAYRVATPCLTEPTVAIAFATEGAPQLQRLGPLWTGEPVYDHRTGECAPTAPGETPWSLYPVVGPGTNRTLVPLTLESVPGDALDFLEFVDVYGLVLGEGFVEGRFGRSGGGPFRDAAGIGCGPWPTPDGARCVPGDVQLADDDTLRPFADASCTEPLAATPGAPPGGFGVVTLAECGVRNPGEPVLTDVFALGASHPGPLFRIDDDGFCIATDRDPSLTYYRLDDSILDTLPQLVIE